MPFFTWYWLFCKSKSMLVQTIKVAQYAVLWSTRSCKEMKWQNVCNSIVSFLPFPSFASLGPLSSTFLRFGQCGLLLLLRQRMFQGFAHFSSWPPWQEGGGSGSPLLLFQAPSGFHSVSEQFPLTQSTHTTFLPNLKIPAVVQIHENGGLTAIVHHSHLGRHFQVGLSHFFRVPEEHEVPQTVAVFSHWVKGVGGL